jgi:hypothetical protein
VRNSGRDSSLQDLFVAVFDNAAGAARVERLGQRLPFQGEYLADNTVKAGFLESVRM